MAGMYPENEEVTIFGEKVQWPGVDKGGKFTNGSFSDPHEPPSFIPAGTINLILDNLSGLITKLGGTPNNSSIEQLAGVFTSEIKANTGIMRDAAGRAKVAAPAAEDDIARKAEVDAEAQVRTQTVNSLSQSFRQAIDQEAHARAKGDDSISGQLSSHTGNRSNPHGVTASQLGLGRVNNTPDNEKSVQYAQTAGSAKADGGNADSVGGYKAGNGVNMLVPVVAFNVGETGGYIKLANGLIVQWGQKPATHSNKYRTDLWVSYKSSNYRVAALVANGTEHHVAVSEKKPESMRLIVTGGDSHIDWITIGI